MTDQPHYRWRILVTYLAGHSQTWPCHSEDEARREFARYRHLLAFAAADLPEVLNIRLQCQPEPAWETVDKAQNRRP
jgi:hypothetical protein